MAKLAKEATTVLTDLEKMAELVDKYGAQKEKCLTYKADLDLLKKYDDEICKLADKLTAKDLGDDFYGKKYKVHVSCKNKTFEWMHEAFHKIISKVGLEKFLDLISLTKKDAETVLLPSEIEAMTTEDFTGKRTIKTLEPIV